MQDHDYTPGPATLGNCFLYVVVYLASSIILWVMSFEVIYNLGAGPNADLDATGSFIVFFVSMSLGFFVLGPATTFLFFLYGSYNNSRSRQKGKHKNGLLFD